jgi:hypothetical protein
LKSFLCRLLCNSYLTKETKLISKTQRVNCSLHSKIRVFLGRKEKVEEKAGSKYVKVNDASQNRKITNFQIKNVTGS